jgi:PAS domain-containing protein
VLTLSDIGAAKLYQQQIERSREQLLQTVDLMQEPAIVIDETMHVKTANQAFYRAFGLEPSRTIGRAIVDLEHREWQGERLQALALQLKGQSAAIQGATIGDPSAPNLFASGRQFQLEDGKYWTVLALTPANGHR